MKLIKQVLSRIAHFSTSKSRPEKLSERQAAAVDQALHSGILRDIQHTIMEFSVMDRTRAISFNRPSTDPDHVQRVERERFKIRLAGSDPDLHRSAGMLIEKMYGWRGYKVSGSVPGKQTGDPLTITTLVFGNHGAPVGTATLRFDGPRGLLADELYGPELAVLRAQDRRIVEYCKLAIDRTYVDSQKIVASLMNVFYTYATAAGYTDAVIEVNPRHVSYYVSRAAFECIGEERVCPRVNAPAALLRLDYDVVARQVELYGGRKNDPAAGKSLYRYFLVGEDQAGLSDRLLGETGPVQEG